MTKLYAPTPDGYCGDEDNGQTSAWYVFSALGFYPVSPVDDYYVLGSPLFDKATLQLPDNKKFVITKGKNHLEDTQKNTKDAPENGKDTSVYLNNKKIDGFKLPFDSFKDNGTLEFDK